ncbi:hypothetical protein IH879_21025, partial [candidate division KSB1 bacterium]|nr:hypothetical protein [candidate division KSB1 bacterium]
MKIKIHKVKVMVMLVAILCYAPSLLAGEHGGQEHAGHDHGSQEHGGHDHDAHEHGGKEQAQEETSLETLKRIGANPTIDNDGIINLNNKICLVTDEEVSGKHSVTVDGVVYSTCCKQC